MTSVTNVWMDEFIHWEPPAPQKRFKRIPIGTLTARHVLMLRASPIAVAAGGCQMAKRFDGIDAVPDWGNSAAITKRAVRATFERLERGEGVRCLEINVDDPL